MELQYGDVTFKLIRITDFVTQVVKTPDETNFLYNGIDVRCVCYLNPAIVSNPVGASPQTTYTNLVSKLKNPRQKLKITSGGVVLLESPLAGMLTDFRFGPTCVVHSIDTSHGEGILLMDMQFHTDLGCTDADYLLANRYQWTVGFDPSTYAATHTISGMAHFRMDKMIKDTVSPDELRTKFMIPIPAVNFRRQLADVTLQPGGDAVSYEIVDTEQLLNGPGLQPFGATMIEVEFNREYLSGLETSIGGRGDFSERPNWVDPPPIFGWKDWLPWTK